MNRLRLLLASILARWASVLSRENPRNKNDETNRDQAHRENEARYAAPVTRTIIEIPESILREYHRAQEEQETDNRKNRGIGLSAVIVAEILAGIGMWQAYLSRQSNNQAEQHFITTQRAFVAVSNTSDGKIGEFAFGGPNTEAVFHFKNYGRSIAQDTFIELWPAVMIPDKPAVVINVPAFQGRTNWTA